MSQTEKLPKISGAEKAKRLTAARHAQANNRIEGITEDARGNGIVEAFINGALNTKDAIARLNDIYKKKQ